jgi:hypothetical protein
MAMIKTQCEHCKSNFDKSICEYNKSLKLDLKHFCSLSCSAKYGSVLKKQKFELTKQEYYKNPKKCKICDKAIDYLLRNTNKFCGSSCSAKFNNSSRAIKKTCLQCGEATSNKKFCSIKCFFSDNKNKVNNFIESGKKVANDTFKRYLIEKNGHKCQMCNTIEWGGKPILLILDHVNGNSEDCSLGNLRLICSNCDTLTPTYKGRNKGKGRFSRMKRYKDGKSF